MPTTELLMQMMHSIGTLQASVDSGARATQTEFKALHRRIDDRERSAAEWRRFYTGQIVRLEWRMDQKKNGNGNGHSKIPYAKIATIIGLITVGWMGHIAPGALRSAVMDVLPTAVKTLIGG